VWSVFFILLVFCVVLLCVFTFWIPCCDVRKDFRIKLCSVRLYLQLFVGGIMSYLRYLCLLAYSDVKHILFFCVLCTLCCKFPWIAHFCLSLLYSLTSIDLIHLVRLIRDIDIIFFSMTCSRNVSSYFVAKIYTCILLFQYKQYVYFAVSTEVTVKQICVLAIMNGLTCICPLYIFLTLDPFVSIFYRSIQNGIKIFQLY
jgi:hypothetical protein